MVGLVSTLCPFHWYGTISRFDHGYVYKQGCEVLTGEEGGEVVVRTFHPPTCGVVNQVIVAITPLRGWSYSCRGKLVDLSSSWVEILGHTLVVDKGICVFQRDHVYATTDLGLSKDQLYGRCRIYVWCYGSLLQGL